LAQAAPSTLLFGPEAAAPLQSIVARLLASRGSILRFCAASAAPSGQLSAMPAMGKYGRLPMRLPVARLRRLPDL